MLENGSCHSDCGVLQRLALTPAQHSTQKDPLQIRVRGLPKTNQSGRTPEDKSEWEDSRRQSSSLSVNAGALRVFEGSSSPNSGLVSLNKHKEADGPKLWSKHVLSLP